MSLYVACVLVCLSLQTRCRDLSVFFFLIFSSRHRVDVVDPPLTSTPAPLLTSTGVCVLTRHCVYRLLLPPIPSQERGKLALKRQKYVRLLLPFQMGCGVVVVVGGVVWVSETDSVPWLLVDGGDIPSSNPCYCTNMRL